MATQQLLHNLICVPQRRMTEMLQLPDMHDRAGFMVNASGKALADDIDVDYS